MTELNLNDLRIFVVVVETAGIASASRQLGLSKSSVSSSVTRLEKQLAIQLVIRDSRRFHVTDAGLECYEHGKAMLQRVRAAEAAARRTQIVPTGLLRISGAPMLTEFALGVLLPRFLLENPGVRVAHVGHGTESQLLSRSLDLLLCAHQDELPPSAVMQVVLGSANMKLYAAPGLSAREGLTTPLSLARVPGLRTKRSRSDWVLTCEDDEACVPFEARLTSEDLALVCRAAQAGLGVAALPEFLCGARVAAGLLEVVLPRWSAGHMTITAQLPPGTSEGSPGRALVRLLRSEFSAIMSGLGSAR